MCRRARNCEVALDSERASILAEIGRDDAAKAATNSRAQHSARAALLSWRVWAFAAVYLTGTFSLYGVNFWMPTIVQELGIGKTEFLRVGLVTAIPWGLAGVVMVIVGAHSDRTGERRWHVAGSLLVTACGLFVGTGGHAPVQSVLALILTAAAHCRSSRRSGQCRQTCCVPLQPQRVLPGSISGKSRRHFGPISSEAFVLPPDRRLVRFFLARKPSQCWVQLSCWPQRAMYRARCVIEASSGGPALAFWRRDVGADHHV